ncbi:MAG: DUF1848 domain-containing protein [Polyangiaceae bacterium]|nr:DUF1848 domain-containing protein [Polyangiaceae bacterium]
MIISASYRTDIPTFYGRWFMNRLRAGYCKVVNPFNRQPYRVDLRPEAVDGIVFWTKNLGPFFEDLFEVRDRSYSFVVQYTINGYPRELESSVADASKSVAHMHRLARAFGARVGVWRYDTIVFTSETPASFHRENFQKLAAMMEGATDEVVVSLAQLYRKTERNMDRAASELGFTWEDPPDALKQELVLELAEIARSRGMQLSVCSQRAYLGAGVKDAQCVDARRFEAITGRALSTRLKGNRPECGCFESRDIGDYDTCPHGCVYCYAVEDRERAQARFRAHDPEGELLFQPQSSRGRSTREARGEEDRHRDS